VRATASGGARRRVHRRKVDLGRHYTIRHTGYTKTTRTTCASELGHQDGRSGNGDGAHPGDWTAVAVPTPTSAHGRSKARGCEQITPVESLLPCDAPGVLLVGGEAAERKTDDGGRALGFGGGGTGAQARVLRKAARSGVQQPLNRPGKAAWRAGPRPQACAARAQGRARLWFGRHRERDDGRGPPISLCRVAVRWWARLGRKRS
jgi:hypothetical protein